MEARTKSMKAAGEKLSDINEQLKIINKEDFISFDEKYELVGEGLLKATTVDTLQINVGKMCNQVCKHCHVDAGPDRKEIMTRETMQHCLDAIEKHDIETADLTGGAPELNPNFKWFIEKIKKLGRHIIVRSNLTILLEKNFADYAEFMASHKVKIVSSLPYYKSSFTNRQRGEGAFEKSIEVIKKLNSLGYGTEDSDLTLNLVYNPVGAFLPPSQESLEAEYKKEFKKYGVLFNNLLTITNIPINRYLDYLIASGNYENYMEKLINSFNPAAAQNIMCKNMISVGWDGYLYDCDFNQMLELTIDHGLPNHIKNFDLEKFLGRKIITGQHCYGCTAGAGSSCGGATA